MIRTFKWPSAMLAIFMVAMACTASAEKAVAEVRFAGQVRMPDGSPAAGARVEVVGFRTLRDFFSEPTGGVLGQARCEKAGRFEVSVQGLDWGQCNMAWILARAEGTALAWYLLSRHSEPVEVALTLSESREARGRLVTAEGSAAAGVHVSIAGMDRSVGGTLDAVNLPETRPDSQAMPESATTDSEGRYVLSGVPANTNLNLVADQEPYARTEWKWKTAEGDRQTQVLAPARYITGRIAAADTGEPLENARVSLSWRIKYYGASASGRTDAKGQYRVRVAAAENYTVRAIGPLGSPYLREEEELEFKIAPGVHEHELAEIKLPRGVLLHGEIVEEPGGKPVAGAMVLYQPRYSNPYTQSLRGSDRPSAMSDADGRFVLAVPAGQGHLTVHSPFGEHAIEELSSGTILYGKAGERRMYVHGSLALDLSLGVGKKEARIPVKRGVVVRGKAVGPDGREAEKLAIAYRGMSAPQSDQFSNEISLPLSGGAFMVRGVPADGELLAFMLDPVRKLGRLATIRGEDAAEPLKVELQPCGSLTVRYVDEDGKPVAGHVPGMLVEYTPGVSPLLNIESTELWADEDFIENFDVLNYRELTTDEDGRITYSTLLPGVTYRLLNGWEFRKGQQVREVRVGPGEVVTMPDQVIKDADLVVQAEKRWKAKQPASSQ